MNKRGFIFSISAIYYVSLFILFIGIITLSITKIPYSSSQDSLSIRTMNKLVTNSSSDTPTLTDNWCVKHIAYDANETLTSQSTSVYKTYCEDYNGKRII